MSNKQLYRFKRYGRSYHLEIRTAVNLAAAVKLDEAHWAALSAPTDTIRYDRTFLELLDTDRKGRITSREVKDAITWLLDVLCEHTDISQGSEFLQLNSINYDLEQGRRIHKAVKKILSRLGASDSDNISLEQVRKIKKRIESRPVSVVGVVLPEAARDEQTREFICDVMASIGGVAHTSGSQGIGTNESQTFINQAKAYIQWYDQGQIPQGQKKTDIMPLGGQTAKKYSCFAAVKHKMEQHFAYCRLAALGKALTAEFKMPAMSPGCSDSNDLSAIEKVLEKAPLANANPEEVFKFDEKINPYYIEVVDRFRREVAQVVLEKNSKKLSDKDWKKIKEFFSAHEQWLNSKPDVKVQSFDVEKLKKYIAGSFVEDISRLSAESSETTIELDNVKLVEKAILYQAHMIDFANNFVSFPHLYDVDRRAMFEMGRLVIDGRHFNLAVKVADRAEHIQMAKASNMFVLYVQIIPCDDTNSFEVAVPVTSGDKGNLYIGKRGIFFDTSNRENEARVIDIIENPVSFQEALASPFIRLGRLLTGKIESFATQAEKKLDSRAAASISGIAAEKPQPAQTQTARFSSGGLLMGAGVAVAALGSSIAYITKTLSQIPWFMIAAGILGAILIVMLPITIVAFLKLRRRDLSAILEASGWGINARMRLTTAQGRFFTRRPPYPKGSRGVGWLTWPRVILVLAVIAVLIVSWFLLSKVPVNSKGTEKTRVESVENNAPGQKP